MTEPKLTERQRELLAYINDNGPVMVSDIDDIAVLWNEFLIAPRWIATPAGRKLAEKLRTQTEN